MKKDHYLAEISRKGVVFANRIRVMLSIALGILVLAAMPNNPPIINFAFFSSLAVFVSITIINILLLHFRKNTKLLLYITVFIEASLPTVMKVSFAFSGTPLMVISEKILSVFYWFIILLTLLHNKKSLTMFAGIICVLGYGLLLLLCIFYWKVPYVLGMESYSAIVLDNEISRLILIVAFTAVAMLILKNLNTFSLAAIKHEEVALERSHNLESIISKAKDIAGELTQVSRQQNEIGVKFIDISQSQAAVSEEMSASFEHLNASTGSINHSMEVQKGEGHKAQELVQILKNTHQDVRNSGKRVLDLIDSITGSTDISRRNLKAMFNNMEVIAKGGEEIGNFLVIINDITEKINLLSMNAAIEAARAGEHGRGFAVVAHEIGKLADATSGNAREISAKIEKIIEHMQSGMEIATFTQESTEDIFENVKRIQSRMDEVNNSLGEQELAIDQVVIQSNIISNTADRIAQTTSEQLQSMEENVKTVHSVAESSHEIANHNENFKRFTEIIETKSHELKNLILEET